MKKMIIDEREIVTTRSGRLGPVKKMKIKIQNPPEALRQTVKSVLKEAEDFTWEEVKPRVTLLNVLEGLYNGVPISETIDFGDSDTEALIRRAIERATGLSWNLLEELDVACYRAQYN